MMMMIVAGLYWWVRRERDRYRRVERVLRVQLGRSEPE
jgi:hypothetical protein